MIAYFKLIALRGHENKDSFLVRYLQHKMLTLFIDGWFKSAFYSNLLLTNPK